MGFVSLMLLGAWNRIELSQRGEGDGESGVAGRHQIHGIDMDNKETKRASQSFCLSSR